MGIIAKLNVLMVVSLLPQAAHCLHNVLRTLQELWLPALTINVADCRDLEKGSFVLKRN